MEVTHEEDRKWLSDLPKDKLLDLLYLQVQNLWSADGLYFLNIESKDQLDTAVEIDRNVWKVMGKLEARRLKNAFGAGKNDLTGLFELLKHTSWWLDLKDKDYTLEDHRLVITNRSCYIHTKRLEKGLDIFDCGSVRMGFLKSFVNEVNPAIVVKCNFCPSDEAPGDKWCEWEFRLE